LVNAELLSGVELGRNLVFGMHKDFYWREREKEIKSITNPPLKKVIKFRGFYTGRLKMELLIGHKKFG